MRLLRVVLGLFVTLLVLIVIAAIVLPKIFNPNDYREQITQLVKDKTGRDITIGGDLELSVFPWLGVSTGRLTVSQPNHLSADFGDGNMLEVDGSNLRLKLIPLLKSIRSDVKDIQVDTIVLTNPFVEMITTKDGVTSLDGLTGDASPEQEKEVNAAQAGVALIVQGVNIESGRLVWDDRQNNQRYEVRDLNVETGNLLGGSTESVDISGELLQGSNDLTQFDLNAKARINVDTLSAVMESVTANIKKQGVSAKLGLDKLVFDNDKHALINKVSAKLDMKEPESLSADITIPQVQFYHKHNEAVVDEINASGKYQKSPFSFKVSDIAFNANQMAGSINALKAQAVLIDLAGFKKRKLAFNGQDVRLNMSSDRASVNKLTLASQDIQAELNNVKLKELTNRISASAGVQVKPFNLQALLDDLDVDYAPAKKGALSSVSFVANVKGGFDSVKLTGIALNLDESQLRGNLGVTNFAKPNATFDLSLNKINVDDYIPESEAVVTAEENSGSGLKALFALFPIFEQYKANGVFVAKDLQASGLKIRNINLNARSSAKDTTVGSSAQLYEGNYRSKISYKSLNNGGQLQFSDTSVNNVNLGNLLTDANITDQVKGKGTLGVNMTVEQISGVQSTHGKIGVNILDGAIKGVDLQKILQNANLAYNKAKGREIEEQGEENSETKFASLDANFDLKDGVLSNNDLSIKAPLFRVGGSGVINLEAQELDYTSKVSVVKSYQGQGGQSIEKLKGITIPVRFYGPLTNPKYKIDIKSLLKSVAKDRLRKEQDKYLKEKLGIEGGGSLSTKDALKSVLSKKIQDKYGVKEEPSSDINQLDTPAPDAQPKTKDQLKQELKDELKRKALESLLGL